MKSHSHQKTTPKRKPSTNKSNTSFPTSTSSSTNTQQNLGLIIEDTVKETLTNYTQNIIKKLDDKKQPVSQDSQDKSILNSKGTSNTITCNVRESESKIASSTSLLITETAKKENFDAYIRDWEKKIELKKKKKNPSSNASLLILSDVKPEATLAELQIALNNADLTANKGKKQKKASQSLEKSSKASDLPKFTYWASKKLMIGQENISWLVFVVFPSCDGVTSAMIKLKKELGQFNVKDRKPASCHLQKSFKQGMEAVFEYEPTYNAYISNDHDFQDDFVHFLKNVQILQESNPKGKKGQSTKKVPEKRSVQSNVEPKRVKKEEVKEKRVKKEKSTKEKGVLGRDLEATLTELILRLRILQGTGFPMVSGLDPWRPQSATFEKLEVKGIYGDSTDGSNVKILAKNYEGKEQEIWVCPNKGEEEVKSQRTTILCKRSGVSLKDGKPIVKKRLFHEEKDEQGRVVCVIEDEVIIKKEEESRS